MILNLLHRVSPGETYPYFLLQQEYAHQLKLKVTLIVQLDAMHDESIVAQMKEYHREYGDELGLSLSGFDSPEFLEKIGGHEDFIWLYSREDKRTILQMIVDRYRKVFGGDPVSAAAYHLDASAMQILKEICPAIKISVAGCFEEGVKVFHGCNNSWYLFNEGMPWGPWYPAKSHTLRPAEDENDWAGMVAVPHLSRDLALSYEGRNDFFASHPANAQRGLANIGYNHPYDYNLVDNYRLQEDYNDGFSYYHVFVSPGWLAGHPTIQDPNEVSQKLYQDLLEYFVELRQQGQLTDMYMSEFADWYQEKIPIGKPQVYLAKELLYGSKKHYFWYIDPYCRVLIDTNQGGSIGDLRPYVGKYARSTGPDTPALIYGSYPYLIHSQYRSGISHHYMDGARTTLMVTHNDQTLDLGACRTRVAEVKRDATGTHTTLTPAKLTFQDGLHAEIETTYHFPGSGQILIARKIKALSDPQAVLQVQEYLKGCYGTTEYPEDMHGIQLGVEGEKSIAFEYLYRGRVIETANARATRARIPQINTEIRLEAVDGPALSGKAVEGILFNPYYTLTLAYSLTLGKETHTCLRLSPVQ